MAISISGSLAGRVTLPTKLNWRSVARRPLAASLSLLLLAASLLKLWSDTHFPQAPRHSWTESGLVSDCVATGEAVLGFVLLAGLWPRQAWLAALSMFGIYAIITAAEAIQGKGSCGCFGAVQVRPIYTMSLDLLAVAALLVTGRPDERGPEAVGRGSEKRRYAVAGALALAWVVVVSGMWLTKPAIAVASDLGGQALGKAGELVVLEPEKWAGQRFTLADHILADHIDIGSQLDSGQWIILFVHHDCDHCAAAVPRYVAEYGKTLSLAVPDSRPPTPDLRPPPRLAVIEMPPFGDPAEPPPWRLPPPVLSGRLDQTRDWFATTPVALLVKDGIVISARESDAAETPDPSWWNNPE